MRKLGLTGGIASGKSSVAGMLRGLGFEVIDADSLARELMDPGQTVHEEVIHEFGHGIIDPQSSTGQIDRKKLAAVVFADRAKLIASMPSFTRASRKLSCGNSRNGRAKEM
jgi:dephospho-CoA kinase